MGQRLAWLALAGGAGTLARYGLGGLVHRWAGPGFPWGTLAVNGLGCFLFGIVWCLAEERLLIGGEARIILLVGFMGGFTTFSSYAFETAQMVRDADWWNAAGNLLLQNVLGFFSVFLGMKVGRIF